MDELRVVSHKTPRVDAVKLATGRGTFTDDVELPGMLYAAILHSPHAHARIRRIDTSRARAIPDVVDVITHADVPRVPYTTAGQGHPEPSPWDTYMLDAKARFVGDRVAVVAAEDPATAYRALDAIDVEYEPLPAVFDPVEAMNPGAPVIHDEPDCERVHDPSRNLAAYLHAKVGDVEAGLAAADLVLDREYVMPYVQQCSIEPHIAIAWLDEDNRLVVRTSTQVPFHVRRVVARLCQVPILRVRVIKPRVGGGFGGKQEILVEDLVAILALRNRRPVRIEYTRAEEFHAARARHPHRTRMRLGARRDGTLAALDMRIVENTGAYGAHALTVLAVAGSRSLSLYRCPNVGFEAFGVYTNLPVAGAYRGYGAPQGFFAVDTIMDEAAAELGLDPLEFRERNLIEVGDAPPMLQALGEGQEGPKQVIRSMGLREGARRGAEIIEWSAKRAAPNGNGPKRRGVGVALVMQGTAIPGIDMGGAFVKMNEDGSFHVFVGGVETGSGTETMIAQIAAETLKTDVAKVMVHADDTDAMPFDKGAYASSTTYISGGATKRAAEKVLAQILEYASLMLRAPAAQLRAEGGRVHAPDGRTVTYAEVCHSAFYAHHQRQIMAEASHASHDSPPPFAAQFAEVEVDTETGEVRVLQLVSCVDCGTAINPQMAEGQIEGAATQAMGYALTEELRFDERGRPQVLRFRDYPIYAAPDMPKLVSVIVPGYEPTGPYGAKAIAEIPIDGPAPAIANAVFHATGVRFRELPLTPERVLGGLKAALEGATDPGGRHPRLNHS